jgi:predicted esterase
MTQQSIHQGQPVLTLGAPLEHASAAVILLHGRGSNAQALAALASALPSEGIAYLLPQAAGNTWYPRSGFGPFELNQPYLASALAVVDELAAHVRASGLGDDQLVLGGFSQGAVLVTEYAVQHPARYGGLLIFSGALMGPEDTPRDYPGSFEHTPTLIGGVTQDSWVSEAQLRRTAEVLTQMGADVMLDLHPGAEHGIRASEVETAGQIIRALS